jgi:hypothetical protein
MLLATIGDVAPSMIFVPFPILILGGLNGGGVSCSVGKENLLWETYIFWRKYFCRRKWAFMFCNGSAERMDGWEDG